MTGYMKWYSVLYIGIILFFAGCGTDNVKKHIKRLDLCVYGYNDMSDEERMAVLDSMGPGLGAMAFLMGDSVDGASLERYSWSKAVKIFTPDIIRRLPSLDSVERVLGKVDRCMQELLPEFPDVDTYGIVSPFNQSVFIVDSVMLIGLNHYLGYDYEGYSNFDAYKKRTKDVRFLPYDIVEAMVSSSYPYLPSHNATVLERMMYHGALIYAKMNIVPDASLADALGYTDGQLDWVQRNSREIWNAIIERRLLYSVSLSDADRLLNPAPATMIVHPECPGRVGRYIGYMIVCAYSRNNAGVTLPVLLSPDFYASPVSLVKSRYNGL